nr:2,3-butanediol dehydrogenase [Oceanivirga miroungae]
MEIAFCGICGTDLHEYLDGPIFCPKPGHPHPVSKEDSPITLGHEMSGVVSEVGEGVTSLKVGDHVVVEPYILADDVDTSESSNSYHLTPGVNFIGLAGRGGGLSENIVVKERWVHKIPDSIPLDEAALLEPLSVGVHGVDISGVKEGEYAIVGGAGPIGILIAAVLKSRGVNVIVTELSPIRRKYGIDAGVVDYALNPAEVDIVEEVMKITNGKGADVAFECTSVDVVLDTLLKALKPRGKAVILSIWGHNPAVDMNLVVLKEIEILGSLAYVNTHKKTIELLASGKVNVAPFITARIKLDNLLEEGFNTLINKKETAIKILVSPK